MRFRSRWPVALGLALFLFLVWSARTRQVTAAQTRKPVFMTRLFTGPDGQTHAEDIEVKFDESDIARLMAVTGAEIHRAAAGSVIDWHPGPRRQYIITLSGQGEIEVANGKKIATGPGHIELIEDTTGKGHITRVLGTEDRVTIQIPLTDQAGHP